jgi:hypothetical protein
MIDACWLVVIKLSCNKEEIYRTTYLASTDIDSEWWSSKKEDAWNYSSSVAFDDADRLGGKVFLRTKIREIEVTREDFGYE